jgi:NADH-quinone oxidoreductase subunit L
MTHAFFKALLFLGAGNVMHAMDDELDIFKMGGLAKKMKWTMILMTLASLALAGIYPFAGFFSKDKILEAAFSTDHYVLWTVLWATAGLTAFYSFRLVMLVFFGEERYKIFGFHPHEAYRFMLWAMAPLALLAVIAGFFEHSFLHMVSYILPIEEYHVSTGTFWILVAVTLGIAISGIAVAVYKYSKGGFSKSWEDTFIYKLLFNQYYIPQIYNDYICKPYALVSRIFWKDMDLKIVDATVDFIATSIYKSGMVSRVVQSGNLSNMLRWMGVGLLILLLAAIFYSPVR